MSSCILATFIPGLRYTCNVFGFLCIRSLVFLYYVLAMCSIPGLSILVFWPPLYTDSVIISVMCVQLPLYVNIFLVYHLLFSLYMISCFGNLYKGNLFLPRHCISSVPSLLVCVQPAVGILALVQVIYIKTFYSFLYKGVSYHRSCSSSVCVCLASCQNTSFSFGHS